MGFRPKGPSPNLASNFYLTTAGNFRMQTLLDAILEVGSDERILFSVDYPFQDMGRASSWFDNAEISEPDRRKIAALNAEKLLKCGQVVGRIRARLSLQMEESMAARSRRYDDAGGDGEGQAGGTRAMAEVSSRPRGSLELYRTLGSAFSGDPEGSAERPYSRRRLLCAGRTFGHRGGRQTVLAVCR